MVAHKINCKGYFNHFSNYLIMSIPKPKNLFFIVLERIQEKPDWNFIVQKAKKSFKAKDIINIQHITPEEV